MIVKCNVVVLLVNVSQAQILWNYDVNQGANEPEIFEDDIIMDDRQFVVPFNEKNKDGTVEILNSRRYLWTSGIIPYIIANGFTVSEIGWIKEAMKIIQDSSCIKFVDNGDAAFDDFVHIIKPQLNDVCRSKVGRAGGEQELLLGASCFRNDIDGTKKYGIALHELLHAVGLWHEHSRPDRDSHVDILWDNIPENKRGNNYKIRPWGYIQDACEEYDPYSIMHYSLNINTDPHDIKIVDIMKMKNEIQQKKLPIGQRTRLSWTDMYKLRRMYQCDFEDNCTPNCPEPEIIRDRTSKCRGYPEEQYNECIKLLSQYKYCSNTIWGIDSIQ